MTDRLRSLIFWVGFGFFAASYSLFLGSSGLLFFGYIHQAQRMLIPNLSFTSAFFGFGIMLIPYFWGTVDE